MRTKGFAGWNWKGIAQWIVLVLLATVVLFLVLGVFLSAVSFSYLLFVILTVFAVRSVPVEPGAWLGLRIVRRLLVAVILAITVDLLFVPSLAIPALVALILCDFALGRATRRLAGAPDDVLDERQAVWRNRAYTIAYVLFAATVAAVLVVGQFASEGSRQWLADSMKSGGAFVALIELLAFLPSMVIAWIEPDRIVGADAPRLRTSVAARIAVAMVVLSLVIPIVLSLSIAVGPIGTSTTTHLESSVDAASAPCRYFGARKHVGIGFGATIPMSAVACWNGSSAYEEWGLNASDCHIYSSEFASVDTLECRRTSSPDGTLRFSYRVRVQAAVLPFVTRDLTLALVLSKNGKVVQFP